MQIHELDTFGGSLGSGTFVAVDNGTDTGKTPVTAITSELGTRVDNLINNIGPSEVTTLWTGTMASSGDSATLSDDVSNYDYIDIYVSDTDYQFIRRNTSFINSPILIQAQKVTNSAALNLYRTRLAISGTSASITEVVNWHFDGGSSYAKPDVYTSNPGPSITRIDGVKVYDSSALPEIADARIGTEGVTYPSLGDAIRNQISDVRGTISGIDNYIGLLPLIWEMGGMYSATGIEYNSASRIRTPFISVSPNEELTINGTYNSGILIYEFASDTETTSETNVRLKVSTLQANYPITYIVGASTNYIRVQIVGNSPSAGNELQISVANPPILDKCFRMLGTLPDNTNADDIKGDSYNGTFVINSVYTYTNVPVSVGFLSTLQVSSNLTLQFAISYTGLTIYKRTCLNDTWASWYEMNAADAIIASSTNLTETDLNNLFGKKIWLLSDSYSYQNKPSDFASNVGFLLVAELAGGWTLQLLWQFSGGKMWKRRGNKNTRAWEAWQNISGGGNTYNNEYTFPEYSQILTVNASPAITADTNNYLAPSGDTSDRTADILAMLSSNGICRLGAGNYYINNLQMPEGSAIIGSGNSTKVYLSGTSDGFAIKLNSYCMVKDLALYGSASDLTFTATEGGRHGLLWIGDYTEHQTAPFRGIISDVYIQRFSGGGIRCYDTGYGTSNALEVTNVYITNCWAGIDIAYWSEFHKFTNVRSGNCRIGCVNNGGNNIFINCDFSSNFEIAMLMDNSTGQSPNNSHGSCIGCVFNHTQSGGSPNSGTGIKILNCVNGFMFSGCQIFFSKIELQDSEGIVIADTNFGKNNCSISVSGGGTVLFANNMHQDTPPSITITNNTKVHFVNCYNRTTGAVISN